MTEPLLTCDILMDWLEWFERTFESFPVCYVSPEDHVRLDCSPIRILSHPDIPPGAIVLAAREPDYTAALMIPVPVESPA